MANAAARCGSHDLAVGPDGRCVLCPPASSSSAGARFGVLGALPSLADLGDSLAAVAAVAPFALPLGAGKSGKSGKSGNSRSPSEGIWWLPVGIASGLGLVVLLTVVSGVYLYSTVQASDATREADPSARAGTNAGVLGAREANAENGAPAGADGAEPVAAGAAAGVSIELYGASWCPACRAAKAWLDAHRIAYTEYDIDRDRAAGLRLRSLNPRGSIPVIVVEGSAPMVGFNASQIEAAIARAGTK